MDEYINRKSLMKRLCERCNEEMSESPCEPSECFIKEVIKTFSAADVAPVRHGRWISVKNPQWPAYSHDQCSICGWWNTKNAVCRDGGKYNRAHSLNYCPNCGAKMDLVEDEDHG